MTEWVIHDDGEFLARVEAWASDEALAAYAHQIGEPVPDDWLPYFRAKRYAADGLVGERVLSADLAANWAATSAAGEEER
jgi:hypothetical protein